MLLEDDFNDCLNKAMRGLGISLQKLAEHTRLSESLIQECLKGSQHKKVIEAISPLLGLDGENLIHLEHYSPEIPHIENLQLVCSTFGHAGVNAYLLPLSDKTLVFDTGTDAHKIISQTNLPIELWITHEHADHVGELDKIQPYKLVSPPDTEHYEITKFESLTIQSLDTGGHYNPARSYFIQGLSQPICIVGDAIFAGSIGGCKTTQSYTIALKNIREHLLSLPEETILCSGHGPMTTVFQEKNNNPFF